MLLTLLTLLASLTPASRQPAPMPAPVGPFPKAIETTHESFLLPVAMDERTRKGLSRVLVLMSTDMGRTWKVAFDEPPHVDHFRFEVPRSGEYWFSLQTIDKTGRKVPADVAREAPGMRVIVWKGKAIPDMASREEPKGSDTANAGVFTRPIYTKNYRFILPLQIDEPTRKTLARTRLLVSTDMGRTWKVAGDEALEGNRFDQFRFDAPRNGEYWFTLQIIDKKGRTLPENVAQEPPGLRVIVWREVETRDGDVARNDVEGSK